MSGRRGGGSEVLFEITRLGAYVKVTAIDPVSLQEASVIGPATNASVEVMKSTALRKLRRQLGLG